ncbi:c-type cytochrome biogenesis protein CcsB [bacterium]|nr:c-type cytochrome biogenesis protein CcsB [candidate division CSSED10-310 bacterium]
MGYEAILIKTALVVYILAFVISLYRLISRLSGRSPWVFRIMMSGFMMHTIAFLIRWKATYTMGYGHIPVTNRYESLVFFGWCLVLAWLVTARWIPGPGVAAGMQGVSAVMTAAAGLVPGSTSRIEPLMPALRSNWLLFHVVTCFLAYAAFAIATFIAARILFRSASSPLQTPHGSESREAEIVMHRLISLGFFLLTLGILSGSAWAQQSWGRYWGWDPKEVWSLITWIVYAIFLHARMSRGWSGKKLAILAVIGFAAVLFTFLGVNYLPVLRGLHSYA